MYICECGEEFEEINEETQDHVLNFHLELVESAYQDLIGESEEPLDDLDAEDLYEEAILDVEDELMDEIIEE
jgi:hypothetical protein